jgi:hypothetical protein
MKKIILTVLALGVFSFSNAQDKKSNKGGTDEVRFGLKAGLSNCILSGDTDVKSLLSFHAGGFVNIPVSDKFSVQPELLYSLQGEKGKSIDATLHNDYLNIPVMAKFYAADKFSIEAGPQLGFLLSAKIKYAGQSVDTKQYYNTTDFSLCFGLGYDVSEDLFLSARYNAGLSNLDKSGNQTIKNSVFQISLGYKL